VEARTIQVETGSASACWGRGTAGARGLDSRVDDIGVPLEQEGRGLPSSKTKIDPYVWCAEEVATSPVALASYLCAPTLDSGPWSLILANAVRLK
jgi:hypothetical protein